MSNALPNDLLAEETHSGRVWIVLIAAALIGPLIFLSMARTAAAIGPAMFVGLSGLGIAFIAWNGFRYRFLRHGVEIRLLGFRLRSIPKQSIISYSIEPWAFIRGYGIRGIGAVRAYVWCNKVVHIRTSNGDVFLGHSDPERIVRDLDMVTGVVTRS